MLSIKAVVGSESSTQVFISHSSENLLRSRVAESELKPEPESEVFAWSRSRIPNNTGSQSRIFLSNSDVHMDHFLHHTPKMAIPVEMVQFLLKVLLK